MQDLEYELRQREAFAVVDWRRDQFAKRGASDETAIALAGARHVDVQEYIDLVDAGCDPEVAAEILL